MDIQDHERLSMLGHERMKDFHLSGEHYKFCCSDTIKEICRPFMEVMGIRKIEFSRYYSETHETITLSTAECYMRYYIENKLYNYITGTPNIYARPITSFDDVTHDSSFYMNVIKPTADKFNYAHTVIIVKFRATHFDLFSFSVAKDRLNFHDECITDKVLYQKFMVYFRNSARHIIKEAKEKYGYRTPVPTELKNDKKQYAHFKKIYSQKTNAREMMDMRLSGAHYEDKPELPFELKKYYLDEPFEEVSLTKREAEVLLLITDELTAKEISRILGISTNTVRDHADHLRYKFKCETKKSLIRLVKDYNLCDYFIDELNVNIPATQSYKFAKNWKQAIVDKTASNEWIDEFYNDIDES
ncbi:MAG: LuxR C-terminal-related transcriptional regulator [Gammaproteobacteria bacterium]|nr:LuxR C-terminal-related transcriptional regulator [Gammaproteobacteria bacterium]